MLRALLSIGFVLCLFSQAYSQDTIRIMYYNILNFPDESPERVEELRKIVGYAKPDILVVNELLSSEGSAAILSEALNAWGATNYAAATYIDGPDTDNMLYYNTDLLGLKSQQVIPTTLRDINRYELYYKSPGLNASSDTVLMNIYSVHLKAGSAFFDRRKEEALILKFHLNSFGSIENVFVGGDFNFYSGNESGCLALRETGDVDLFDPIDQIGDWNNNPSYAGIHTQSTRTASLSDGAGGGMDDRFDLIFTSLDALNNSNGIEFIPGTYTALGQDGARFNGAINSPFNSTVPDTIVNALYYMSDHLPVMMDLKTDYTANINELKSEAFQWYYNRSNQQIRFNATVTKADFVLYDLSGRVLFSIEIANANLVQLPNFITSGVYLWQINGADFQYAKKVIITPN